MLWRTLVFWGILGALTLFSEGAAVLTAIGCLAAAWYARSTIAVAVDTVNSAHERKLVELQDRIEHLEARLRSRDAA